MIGNSCNPRSRAAASATLSCPLPPSTTNKSGKSQSIRSRVPSVIAGIARGYGVREPRRKDRLDALIKDAAARPGGDTAPIVRELEGARSVRWAWVDWLDAFWTLPPVRRSSPRGEPDDPNFDHAKYDAIGESDRMTLRFIKAVTD